VFFSHNKSAGTVFQLAFSAKRMGLTSCFSLTTNQPEQYFGLLFQRNEWSTPPPPKYKEQAVRAVPIKKTSSFYKIGYRTKKSTAFQPMVSMSNNYFLSLSQLYLLPLMGVRHELHKNWWFLPNGNFMVSWCIGSRVDLISS